MQFVANGPDIPDALLQAHEEGRVVFFCGAGISYPAGLPGFKGLVKEIYRLIGTSEFDLPAHKGHTVLVKGLFIKATPTSRVNVTSVTMIAASCTAAK